MHDPHVSGQRIIPREGLLLGAEVTSHFLLPRVMNRVFVACQIIRPREDRVARFAGARVYPLTFVRAGLRIAESYRLRSWCRSRRYLSVTLTLVLLELCWRFEALGTSMIGARVGASIRGSVVWPLDGARLLEMWL